MSFKINNIIADPLTADPTTPADGTLWYRDDLNVYRLRLNGATVDIITSATVTDDQNASEVSYVNTTSGLTASDVQAAIDEIEARVDTNDAKISNVTTDLSIANSGATTLDVASSDGTDATIPAATTSLAGLLTGADKTKLDGIEANAKDDQNASEVPYTNTTSGLTATDTQAAIDEVEGRLDTAETDITNLETDVSALQSGYNRRAAVISIIADNTVAPPTEVSGDRYILSFDGGAPNAAWDGASAGNIVEFDGSVWVATVSAEGWVAYSDTDNKDALHVDDGVASWELREVATTDASGITYTQTTTSDWTVADGSSVEATLDEVGSRLTTNDAKVSADGSVTTHSDVTDAGSGAIITTAERGKLDGIQSGVISAASFVLSGGTEKYTLTFPTAYADTTYSLSVLGGDGNLFTYETKAAGSIVINANSAQNLTNDVMWMAIGTLAP
jgi:hypothetical protein